jgi:hypothetical protein
MIPWRWRGQRRERAMMGRLEQDQGQLFYSFCLEEVVPDDHDRPFSRYLLNRAGREWIYIWTYADERQPKSGTALTA